MPEQLTNEPLPDYGESGNVGEREPGVDSIGRALHERKVCRMRCMRCGKPDQIAAPKNGPQFTYRPCTKCGTFNWEFQGPHIQGYLTEESDRVAKNLKKEDPFAIAKSELWLRFCLFLDEHRVRAADGSWMEGYCVNCVDEPHPDGVCKCSCHSAWEYRKRVEAQTRVV